MESILIVDDDKSIRYSLKRMMEGKYSILTAQNGDEALDRMKESSPDLIIMDIKMPGRNGIEVLKEIRSIDPKSLVILMTAYGTTETAIEAMKYGAFDYILKPFPIPQMKGLVEKALSLRRMMRQEVAYAPPEAKETDEGERIIGSSPKMQEIYKIVGQIAPSDVTVLLRGESGTGRSSLRGRFTSIAPVRASRFSPSIVRRSPTRFWRANSSAMRKGLSPGPLLGASESWNSAREGRSSWTRSGICPSPLRPNYCGSFRRRVSKGWGEWRRSRWISG